MIVKYQRLCAWAIAPQYMTPHAAGADVFAANVKPFYLHPGEHRLVPTGFAIAVPEGFEAQVRPRSGTAFKMGVTVLNSPGTVDPDYRGEVGVLLINHGNRTFTVYPGDRIAQLIIAPVVRAVFEEATQLDATARGNGGFGSTGGA